MDHGHPGMSHEDGHNNVMDQQEPESHVTSGHSWIFTFTSSVTLLFREWTTDSKTFTIACVGVALLAMFYEGLKILRGYLIMKTISNGQDKQRCCTVTYTVMHLLQTLLHAIQVAISYILMLVVMTFNSWLCISVLVGATFGYLIFGWTIVTKKIIARFDACH